MDLRDRVIAIARRETIDRGVVPSLNTIADKAGVSKGGLIHHFRSRAALIAALADAAITDVDAAMNRAATTKQVAETWLRLAVLSPDDVALFRAIALSLPALGGEASAILHRTVEATRRWEAMIAAEVGDPHRARIIRLVGDGLSVNALIDPVPDRDIDALVAALLPPRHEAEVIP